MQRQNKAIQEFYNSIQWKRVRNAYKKSKYGLCERCGQTGYLVHHKCYLNMANIYDDSITLNFDNLELLCLDCHNKEHFANRLFDDDGNVRDDGKTAFELLQK